MNARIRILAAAATFASLGALASETRQPVALKEQSLPLHVQQALKDKAAQGPVALRQYIQRTRMIYNLSMATVVRDDAPTVAARKEGTQVAVR